MKEGKGYLSAEFCALDIEQSWHRDPGWFRTLPRETKAELMAFWRVKQGQ